MDYDLFSRLARSLPLLAALTPVFASSQPATTTPYYFFPATDAGSPVILGASAHSRLRFELDSISFVHQRRSLKLTFLNPSAQHTLTGERPSGQLNVLHGTTTSRSVPIYQQVRYGQIYPGVDAVFASSGTHLKSEYHVAAGADPSLIRWQYSGASKPVVSSDGSLEVGDLREDPPYVFQRLDGSVRQINCRYIVSSNQTVSFELGDYDHRRELIIDPNVTFSSYWGGNQFDSLTGVAIGSDGSIYAAGWTESYDNVTSSAYQLAMRYPTDAFVMKLSSTGASVLYATYLGGSAQDGANSIAVDSTGAAYITGYTGSSNFPTTAGAYQTTNRGTRDAFVAKLNSAGNALSYSTYLGGAGADAGNAIRVDSSGNAYIAGTTGSTNFPVQSAFQSANGGLQDAFLTKLNATGTALLYSTYFGGSGNDQAFALALNVDEPYITGATDSLNLPLSSAAQTSNKGGQDAFVARFANTGSTLRYSTYLGGSSGSPGLAEMGLGITTNSSGEAYVTGTTSSLDFPVLNAIRSTFGGGTNDAFVTKYSTAGAVQFSTYLGGAGLDSATSIALDSAGSIYLAGTTTSPNFPLVTPIQSANKGQYDAFVARLNSAGNTLTFSSYWGGSGSDSANAMAISGSTLIFAGQTLSWDFPLASALQSTNPGNYGGFLTRISVSATAASKTGIFRNGLWVIDGNGNGVWDGPPQDTIFSLGSVGDIPVRGDWNGDGKLKAGVFRNGFWLLDYNGNGLWDGPSVDKLLSFGLSGDIPVVGDWNGDKKTKVGIFRNGVWVLDYTGNGIWDGPPTDAVVNLGQAGDTPIVGDWNGNGKTKAGIYRNGLWILDVNGNGQWDGAPTDLLVNLGQSGDVPILGDWSGNGKTKVGIFRAGLWLLDYNGNGGWDGSTTDRLFSLGGVSDTPVIGDWSGDGRSKIGIFRNGTWLLDFDGDGEWRSDKGEISIVLGQSGDVPVVAPW